MDRRTNRLWTTTTTHRITSVELELTAEIKRLPVGKSRCVLKIQVALARIEGDETRGILDVIYCYGICIYIYF